MPYRLSAWLTMQKLKTMALPIEWQYIKVGNDLSN